MRDQIIEAFAIRAAKGNNGGEWLKKPDGTQHYTEDQKNYWRQFVRDIAVEIGAIPRALSLGIVPPDNAVHIVNLLRAAFQRKRYGRGEYDPDFDLFDVAADRIETLLGQISLKTHPEDSALIDAVVNAHIGVPMKEHHALMLLADLGMDGDEADELLADARHESSKP